MLDPSMLSPPTKSWPEKKVLMKLLRLREARAEIV
jgi:hypothetical protein